MSIWFGSPSLQDVASHRTGTMVELLDIRFTELGPDFVRATMPVDERTRQLMGILHGGASCALAETVGSVGANLCLDRSRFYAVGQDINANHLRPIASGLVTATAKPFHLGSRSSVWHIEIHDERQRLVCVSRLTMAVIDRQAAAAGK